MVALSAARGCTRGLTEVAPGATSVPTQSDHGETRSNLGETMVRPPEQPHQRRLDRPEQPFIISSNNIKYNQGIHVSGRTLHATCAIRARGCSGRSVIFEWRMRWLTWHELAARHSDHPDVRTELRRAWRLYRMGERRLAGGAK